MLVSKKKLSLKFASILIVIFIIVDLWASNSKFIKAKQISEVYKTPGIVRDLKKELDQMRIFDREGYYLPTTLKGGIENITGAQSLYFGDYRNFIWEIGDHKKNYYESFFEINTISNTIILNLLNVKYVIDQKPLNLPNLKLIEEYKNVEISHLNKIVNQSFLYENLSLLPRAYIVPNAAIVSRNDMLKVMHKNSFDPKKLVLLERFPIEGKLVNSSTYQEATIVKRTANNIDLKVNMKAPGFLVVSEIYYPGWKAIVNEQEKEILRGNYLFRTIYLNKGTNAIRLSYEPFSFKLGATLSFITLLLIASILYYLRKSK